VTPDQLLDHVWGEPYLGSPHLLQVNIARLRKKLGEDARHPAYLVTRPGIGYLMAREEAERN
jgi:DNA-binding response OmpR family regulator